MDELAAGYQLLREDAAWLWLERDVVRVSGPDAVAFLQGQLSQEVAGLVVGESAWSWLLQPQGKVDALLRVSRIAADAVVLDTDGGFGEEVVARLNRFKLRVKAVVEPVEWRCLAVRGPNAVGRATGEDDGSLVVDAGWPGLAGVDRLGVQPRVDPGLTSLAPAVYEVARIEAGVPRMGAELSPRTIPAETGILDRTVSFTKGCYTGQELVARIDSRGGHVARHLRGVRLDQPAPAGSSIVVGGKQAGALTSVAVAPGGGAVGLAYVRREVEPPAAAEISWPGHTVAGQIEMLPLCR